MIDRQSPHEPGQQHSHLCTDHLRGDLARHSVHGTAVTAIGQAVKLCVQFGSIIILARLLTPHAFGLVAMVAVVVSFLELIKDLGLSAATVQREHIRHDQVSTLFWLNVALGCVAAALTAALAPALAWFFEEPELVDITLALSLAMVVGGLGTQHLALLRRQMRFTALMVVRTGAEIAAMAIAVWAALSGADYWALVIQRIAWAMLLTTGSWIFCGWRPGLPSRNADLRSLLVFGGNVTGSNIVGFATRNLDQLLIGWYWGAGTLGFYERAYKLLLVPINNMNTPLFTVLMPTLSRLADQPERYRRTYTEILEKLLMLTMPCAGMVIVIPDWIISTLFGPGWEVAAPILGWLGVAMLYQPATYTGSWLFMSQNRTREMFRWSLLSATLGTLAVVAGLPLGADGVAAVWAVSGLVLRVPALFWIVGRRGPVGLSHVARCLVPGSCAAAAVGVVLWTLRTSTDFEDLVPWQGLTASLAIAATVTLVCYAILPQGRNAIRSLGKLYQILFHQRASA